MLEADSRNIFGSEGGVRGAITYKPGAVVSEKPTDGTPYFTRDILGTDLPTQYVLLEADNSADNSGFDVMSSDFIAPEQLFPIQRTQEVTEAAARVVLNSQFAHVQ